MKKAIIQTDRAPQAIGAYSQATKINNMVFLSGQIPLVPETMMIVSDKIELQIHQVFMNLDAVARAAGGTLQDIVKLNIYLLDLAHFSLVNHIMAEYIQKPYPARAVVGVTSLPKNAHIEIEGIMILGESHG